MSTAWPLEASGDSSTPLPLPWAGDVDLQDKQLDAGLIAVANDRPELALEVCRRAFISAEAKGNGQAALQALYLACVSLYNSSQDALADRMFAMVRERSRGVAKSVLSTRIELTHAKQLSAQGEHTKATVIRQSALGTAMALGDNDLIFVALASLAYSAIDVGEAELVLAIDRQQEDVLPDNAAVKSNLRSSRDNYMALAWMEIAHARRSASDESAARSALHCARAFALPACIETNNDTDTVHALETLVQILLRLGDIGQARTQMNRVAACLNAVPPPGGVLWRVLQLAAARIDVQGDTVSQKTIDTLKEIEYLQGDGRDVDPYGVDVQETLLAAHERLGHHEQTLACHKRATEWRAQRRSARLRQRLKMLRHTVLSMRAEAVEFIAHDLLTPLAAAQTWMQTLSGERLQPAAMRLLEDARTHLNQAMTLSEQLLGMLRAELLPRTDLLLLDVGALADDVCESAPPLKPSSLRVSRDIAIGTAVLGDATLLTRALTALLADALSRAPAHTPVQLQLTRDATASEALLSISHQGPGPTDAVQTRLYQQFIDSKRFSAGELGLALAAKVARLHRARLRFENTPGQGSRLWFSMKATSDALIAPLLVRTAMS